MGASASLEDKDRIEGYKFFAQWQLPDVKVRRPPCDVARTRVVFVFVFVFPVRVGGVLCRCGTVCGHSRATSPCVLCRPGVYACAGCMESTAAGTWATEGGGGLSDAP